MLYALGENRRLTSSEDAPLEHLHNKTLQIPRLRHAGEEGMVGALARVMRGWHPSECKVKTSFSILMLRQQNPVVAPVDFWGLPWLCAGPEDHDSLRSLLAAEENPCTA